MQSTVLSAVHWVTVWVVLNTVGSRRRFKEHNCNLELSWIILLMICYKKLLYIYCRLRQVENCLFFFNVSVNLVCYMQGKKDIVCLVSQRRKQFALTKCWPHDPVPVGVKELLVVVHHQPGYKVLSFLLDWFQYTEIYPSVLSKPHFRCILIGNRLQGLNANSIYHFTDSSQGLIL